MLLLVRTYGWPWPHLCSKACAIEHPLPGGTLRWETEHSEPGQHNVSIRLRAPQKPNKKIISHGGKTTVSGSLPTATLEAARECGLVLITLGRLEPGQFRHCSAHQACTTGVRMPCPLPGTWGRRQYLSHEREEI